MSTQTSPQPGGTAVRPFGSTKTPSLDVMLDKPAKPKRAPTAHEKLAGIVQSAKNRLDSVTDFLLPGAMMAASGASMFVAGGKEGRLLADWKAIMAAGGSQAQLAAASQALDAGEATQGLRVALDKWKGIARTVDALEVQPGAVARMHERLRNAMGIVDMSRESVDRALVPRG